MSSPLLSVIIVSYNTKDLTLQTLTSVEKEVTSSKRLNKQTDIFVVDNDSKDDSVKALKAFAKNTKVPTTIIANKQNLGFGAANNQAVKKSNAKYVVFLNSDTIVKKGGLEKVISAFELAEKRNPEATSELSSRHEILDKPGIIASTLLNQDGSVQPQGGDLPSLTSIFSHMFFLDDLPIIGTLLPSTQHTGVGHNKQPLAESETQLIPMGWVGGTALFASKKMLDDIGPFDENIFMYGEDIELCMRAKRHHWDVAMHPQAHVVHLQNMSSSSKNAIVGEFEGYLYIWSKHKPLWQFEFLRFFLALGALLRIALFGTIVPDRHKAAAYKEAFAKVRQF